MPFLYIISGCNGAGKTTASFTILPEMLLTDTGDELLKSTKYIIAGTNVFLLGYFLSISNINFLKHSPRSSKFLKIP